MKIVTNIKLTSVIFVMSFILLPRVAFAYLDPGTGSYILQLVIAGILGASFAIKMSWRRIKVFFANLFGNKLQEKKDDN